jgi:hypothetical protein
MAGITSAGFTAMPADIPGVAEYRTLLSDHGVRPAPGYFEGDFDVPAAGLPELIDAAGRHVGVQAELGLTGRPRTTPVHPGCLPRPRP